MGRINKSQYQFWVGAIVIGLFTTEVRAQDYVPGEIIVKTRGKTGSFVQQRFAHKVEKSKKMNLKSSWGRFNMHRLSLKASADMNSTLAELRKDPDIEYAEPNYYLDKFSIVEERRILSLGEVEDVISSSSGTGTFGQTDADIQASEAWPLLSDDVDEIVVAVIDTGVDYNHEVFAGTQSMWVNEDEIAGNGVDDDGNGFVDDVRGWNFVNNTNDPWDDDGHGTHVAGIVLGVGQDIFASTLGVAKIKIMPLKFLDASGAGTTADAIEAIYYAVNNGAKVLNNSWGGGNYSAALHEAITQSYQKQTLFVAAAGNIASNNDASPMYPASYEVPNIVAVAATDSWDYLASFSNFGAATVDLGSPGVGVLSTFPSDSYGLSSGTSMSAPFVAGVATLMAREAPQLTGYQLKEIMFGGEDIVGQLSGKVFTSGRLNVYNSVALAKASMDEGYQPSYDMLLSAENRELASYIASGGGGCGLIKNLRDGGGRGPFGPTYRQLMWMALFILLPLLLVGFLRQRDRSYRRRHDRFLIQSGVTVRSAGRELKGTISSISVGGARISLDEMLDRGGTVQMKISGPDGKETVDVEGRVVWTEDAQTTYGIQFEKASQSVLSRIKRWTAQLVKSV